MRLKVFLNSILFIIITVCILSVLSVVITSDYSAENIGIRAFYKEKKNTFEAVFVGASATYTNWLTTYAWHNYGFPTAVYSIPCMPCGVYKYTIKDILNYQNPKVIIINIDSILPYTDKGNHLLYVLRAIESVKFSGNKLQMINYFKKAYKLSYAEILEYFFPVIRFHSTVFRTAFKDMQQAPLKGALTRPPHKYYDLPDKSPKPVVHTENTTKKQSVTKTKPVKNNTHNNIHSFEPNWDFLINDLFSYLKSLDTKIILIINPTRPAINDNNPLKMDYTQVLALAKKYDLECIDFTHLLDFNPVNLNTDDFLDYNHLNYIGARKYTDYFCQYFKNELHFIDKRGDKEFTSWDNDYKEYVKIIRESFNLSITE